MMNGEASCPPVVELRSNRPYIFRLPDSNLFEQIFIKAVNVDKK